jgi:vacuolar protein sorting-associated protein 13A/C
MVQLPTVGGKEALLGIDVQEGLGRYHKSKIVTVGPRFVLRNKMGQDLSYAQAGFLTPKTLKSGQICPLMKMNTGDSSNGDFLLCIRFAKMTGTWSSPFSMTQVGSIYLKMIQQGSSVEELVRVDITIEKATIYISFSIEVGRWPFRIDNGTNVQIDYHQSVIPFGVNLILGILEKVHDITRTGAVLCVGFPVKRKQVFCYRSEWTATFY